MRIDASGQWLQGVRRVPSPNRDARPGGAEVDLIVVHGISLPPGEYGGGHVERLFCNRLVPGAHPYFRAICGLRVSAHLLIERDARVTQFVPFGERAWHAGESAFMGRPACNDYSIGIELEGTDTEPYADVQYRKLAEICALLMRSFPAITPARIVGHADVAPGRKTDPGPAFDWPRLYHLLATQRRGTSRHSCEEPV